MKCNRNKLAALLGRDVKTIDRMVKNGMPYLARPGQDRGKGWVFDTGDVIEWLAGGDLDEQLRQAKTRLIVANAGLKEIEHLERLGILHDVKEEILAFEEVLSITKSRLLAIPGRSAHAVAAAPDAEKVQSILEREVRDAFTTADRFLDAMRQKAADGVVIAAPAEHSTNPNRR
jgi:hypothetical protein